MTQTDDEGFSLVLKIETDAIKASMVAVATLFDVRSLTLQSYGQPGGPTIQDLVDILPAVDTLIVQTPYAVRTMERLYGLVVDPNRVIDTVALAKRLRPFERHGMDAWASRFGIYRRKFLGTCWWTQEAQDHCESDAKLVGLIYETLRQEVTV